MHSRDEKLAALGRVIDTLDILRVKCPWDAKQTNESLRPNTIEETYELAQALLGGNDDEIRKELGDVLLHILFYAKIGSEKKAFDIADVADALNEKLIYRHPHIFGDVSVKDSHDVETNWEALKLKEKGGNRTVLAGVPEALPALVKAYRVQQKAANVGFDWNNPADVWGKVREEMGEVQTEIESVADVALHSEDKEAKEQARKRLEAEFGDLLFAVINAARKYKVNPENALELTNRKFIRRFNYIEEQAMRQGRHPNDMTLDEMDALWDEAKQHKL